jgi:hypothetical protein
MVALPSSSSPLSESHWDVAYCERFRMLARTRAATSEGPAFENGRGRNTRGAGPAISLLWRLKQVWARRLFA